MRRSLLVSPLALVLVVLAAIPAAAGGWATVGLDSTPAGAVSGKPWNVNITVLQHGRTPLSGITPSVAITSGTVTREFAARPTKKPGTYRASVVFPSAGRWSYTVDDGFMGQAHTYPAVTIAAASVAAPPATAADDGGVSAGWLWGAAGALVLAVIVLGVDRRRRSSGAPPHTLEPAA